MTNGQAVLFKILSNSKRKFSLQELKDLSVEELARLYVDVAFLGSAAKCFSDEHWLEQKSQIEEVSVSDLAQRLFQSELGPISYLQRYFSVLSVAEIKKTISVAEEIEDGIIGFVLQLERSQQKRLLIAALSIMAYMFELENRWQAVKILEGRHLSLSLYRAFDRLDDVLSLNYAADIGMLNSVGPSERLYEGAGVGVQSGYSTVVTALEKLNLPQGARFIDLGSGYGRVGLVVGLMRPDISFSGYEYVPHRVQIAQQSSENLGLQGHVQFFTQDLSLESFKIPKAEVYYLYDPFTEETYKYVLAQLIEYSRTQKIVIVTKGNARKWMSEVVRHEAWPQPTEYDNGNLCFFASA